MKKYIILLLALCSMSACDYEAVNTNPYGVSDGELGPLKYGARFMNMQQRVIPIGSPSLTTGPGNDLQNTDLISSGNYIGYFGNNNNWGFNNEANWNFTDSRMNYAYQKFVGVGAFTNGALEYYHNTPRGPIEKIEENDSFRFIENRKDCYYINAHCKTLSVDTPKDRVQVERYMKEHDMA